ncbi:hypothetical protein BCR33DRAFT_716641 [Rhizoclosmatium globosum]|uniref:Uncharacterized protein n=1 Tax=Rhizoclosmatium globosum TaxID=329046 RepID=A0A1Y2CE68_9FUNG|nr:hypothetical protein BCR33DRAFT_716641 [Rhizoclosmatium globosum]|eukprot:ORY45360.1 hypothetical protein BCR33DRAFT_716641 [Rhizoclosmatium globosum]
MESPRTFLVMMVVSLLLDPSQMELIRRDFSVVSDIQRECVCKAWTWSRASC